MANRHYTKDLIVNYADTINWSDVSHYAPFEVISAVADDYSDMFNWMAISNRIDLSDEFILKYVQKLDLNYLNFFMSLELIYEICELDESLIESYTWHCISSRHLSEEFVRKHHKKINWNRISTNLVIEQFSDQFFVDFENHIHWNVFFRKIGISPEFKIKFQHKNKQSYDF